MRVVSILSLLHVSLPCIAAFKLAPSSERSLARRSVGTSSLKASPADIFRAIDSNSDGKISISELHTAANFGWDDQDASRRSRVTFGIAHPFEFIQEFDGDGDGYLSFEELSVSLSDLGTEPTPEAQQTCDLMQSRLDTCRTSQILKCNSYIDMAERICHLGQPSIVQHCIMSSPCSSLCSCIEQAEKAAHGQATFTLQHPDGRQEHISSLSAQVNSTEVGMHQPQKRFFWIFLVFAIVEITVLSYPIALISLNTIAANTQKEYKNLDFKVWDGKNDPPSCAAYVFWSKSCGAILSGGARGCSDGGTRLYQNSCKDHFRYGSQGCGFLGLGCKSLCYAINPKGCPCSIVDKWTQQDDIDYPGNDLESLRVAQVSDCRNACATSTKCLAFVVPPPSDDQNKPNCYLKSALGQFSKSGGVTSFLKVTADANSCTASLGGGGGLGVYDKREISASALNEVLEISTVPHTSISARADQFDRNKLWPFLPVDSYLIAAQFLAALYRSNWINQEQLATRVDAVLTSIGARNLVPDPAEPVTTTANPRWRFNESWRLANVFRALLYHGTATTTPVARYLNNQGTSNLANALFPASIRTLLINNEQTINANTLTWAGARSSQDPYPNVNSAVANGVGFYQGGAQGPFTLETAFLLASQIAGINWARVATNAVAAGRPLFWANAIVPAVTGGAYMGQCISSFTATSSRRIGFLQQGGSATGDPRAGMYFIVDVDGARDENVNPNRNVFVFAMHTIDPHSRVSAQNGNSLSSPTYTTIVPGGSTTAGPSDGRYTRFLAHAHAAWVPYNRLSDFMAQDGNAHVTFPGYTQVGSFHLYILSEDTSTFPRNDYINGDSSNPPRRHDEL